MVLARDIECTFGALIANYMTTFFEWEERARERERGIVQAPSCAFHNINNKIPFHIDFLVAGKLIHKVNRNWYINMYVEIMSGI